MAPADGFEGRISRLEADVASQKENAKQVWEALDKVRNELGALRVEVAKTNTILLTSHNFTLWIAGIVGAAASQIASYGAQHWFSGK